MLLLVTAFVLTGCARVEHVKVLDAEPTQPYDSLGVLEVETPARLLGASNITYGAVEAMTLSFAKTPTFAEQYKQKLNEKLIKKARNHYNADALINVQYWPDMNQRSFPDGMIHARGEMIHYQAFPENSSNT